MNSIKRLKITTLTDNLTMTRCLGQWGFSLLLETWDKNGILRKAIFDTGLDKKSLLYNIKHLKVDLSDLDCIVISHGHFDHTSATVEVVKMTGGVKVYAHPHTFLPRFHEDESGKRSQHGVPKNEGIADIEQTGGEVFLTSKPYEILPGVWTTGQIERLTQFEQPMPLTKGEHNVIVTDEGQKDDEILDDQALWMQVEGKGIHVITGCAHSGLINTLIKIRKLCGFKRLHGLIGGTHLVGRSEEYLHQSINEMKKFELSLISPCHCTGFKASAKIWQFFQKEFMLNYAGRIIDSDEEVKKFII